MRFGFWKILNDPKSKIFLLLQITQNGPIRENKWLKPKSGTFFWKFWMTLALQCLEASRLSHFSTNFENEVLVDFFLLLQITQNGPIRENKWLKPKSGTFFCHFWMTLPLQCLEASRLSHFRQIFRKNFFCSKWLRMVQFAKKSGRNRNLRISPSQWVPGSQT